MNLRLIVYLVVLRNLKANIYKVYALQNYKKKKEKKEQKQQQKSNDHFHIYVTHKGKFMSVSGQAEEGKGDMIIGHFVLEGVYYVYG